MFRPCKVSSDVHTGWIHGRGIEGQPTILLSMDGPGSRILNRQIATVRSEDNEKLEVKAKAMTEVPLELNNITISKNYNEEIFD